mmetsp:Transcript_134722/g.238322  ORF Transcript_134722/g.238322 Transcript_134722/m.238322 type:complete len:121 (+) Transcript_134722:171-533(+)
MPDNDTIAPTQSMLDMTPAAGTNAGLANGAAMIMAPGSKTKWSWFTSPGFLKRSSIRLLTTKPPKIFTDDNTTEEAARNSTIPEPPCPMSIMPPIAVVPEMALVTDINGVCKACATPQTA